MGSVHATNLPATGWRVAEAGRSRLVDPGRAFAARLLAPGRRGGTRTAREPAGSAAPATKGDTPGHRRLAIPGAPPSLQLGMVLLPYPRPAYSHRPHHLRERNHTTALARRRASSGDRSATCAWRRTAAVASNAPRGDPAARSRGGPGQPLLRLPSTWRLDRLAGGPGP